jgi:hypothetical protein
MLAIEFAIGLIALCAAAQTPEKPAAPAEPAAQSAETASDIAAALREKTRHQSCTVTYRATREDDEFILRIVYAAPGRVKMDAHNAEGSMKCWILPDRWVVQADKKDDPLVSDIDTAKVFASDFNEVLAREFPIADVPSTDMGPGGVVSLRLHPDQPVEGDHYLEFALTWLPRREHPFDWLARPEDWKDARVEADHLVLEYPGGARVSLSRETGWQDEMVHPSGSRIQLVDFSTTVDEAEFVIPAPKEGMRDVTQDWIAGSAPMLWYCKRICVYIAASRACRDQTYGPEVVHEKLTTVFASIYGPEVRRFYGPWAEENRVVIDQFVAWCERRLKQIGDDPDLRDQFDDAVADWRSAFSKNLAAAIDRDAAKTPVLADEHIDTAFVPEIRAVEQEAMREAYRAEIAEPLLTQLETSLRSVGAIE